ncbi:hypothetical protein ACJVDH_10665 [Pedobacter sp. AW1-32]|uniref:hypothetical protein n=1 Tax=Pedobacter sp. AW1-32 TaxID=3383026 RepID=UPI003FF07EEC
MSEYFIQLLVMAGVAGGALAFFYTMLLKLHGFEHVQYKYVALILIAIIILLGIISFETAGIGCFVIGIGVFVLAIAHLLRSTAEVLKEQSGSFTKKNQKTQNGRQETHKADFSNYVGVIFHFVVIILISFSIFTYSDHALLDKEKTDRLIADAFFQFISTIMLMLLGVFNPFVAPSKKIMGLTERVDPVKFPKIYQLLSKKVFWVVAKIICCIAIVGYFVSKGYFNLVAWNSESPLMNVYLLLIGFFILANLVQMVRQPEYFFHRNLFRITLLFRSAFLSIFLSAILVVATMVISIALNVDMNKLKVSSETILFLGFNIVMCYNEFRLARS